MSHPRKGPTGRSLHLDQASENETFSGDELYIVWTGPIVVRNKGGVTAKANNYSLSANAPGFARTGKTGLRAWIIKPEYVARRNLWGLLAGSDSRRSLSTGQPLTVGQLQQDEDLLDFLSSHVHEVEISTGANADVLQTVPKADECWVRADTNERRLHVGSIVPKPDKAILGYRGVPIGSPSRDSKNGVGAVPINSPEGASHNSTAQDQKARMQQLLRSLSPGERIYGNDGQSDVRIPRATDTVLTDNATHNMAIRVTPEFVSIDNAAMGSTYKVTDQLNPNRFK